VSVLDLDSILERISSLQKRYDANFAGQPRITRNPSLLDEMAKEATKLLSATGGLTQSDEKVREVVGRLESSQALYTNEAASIRAAQDGGADTYVAHELSGWAQLVFERYRRHFAGQSRSTRDLGLLAEIIHDLVQLEKNLEALEEEGSNDDALESLRTNLALYRSEQVDILTARGAGTLQEQSGILASIANDQFDLYRAHFANHARLSRRPGVLERMIQTLEGVMDRMEGLRTQGLHSESNDQNISIVQRQLTAYRAELTAVRKTRQNTTFENLVNGLGEAANQTFQRYREHFSGQDRATRDGGLLGVLCDGLYDLARQMDDLDGVREDETNQHNLSVVLDHLRMYQREHRMVVEAKAGS
jgi:hypothetical protein